MCYGGLPFLCFLVNVRVVYGSFDGLRNHCGLRDCIDYAKILKNSKSCISLQYVSLAKKC